MPERALTVTFLGNTAGLEAAMKRTTAGLNGMQAAGVGMQSLGRSMTRNLTVPIVGIGVAAATMAAKFQASMEQLHTQAGVSQSSIAALSQGVLKMAGSVGASPEALAKAMYHVASSLNATLPAATRSATELKVLKVAAEGAAVGHADLTDVTNALDAAVVSGIKGVQNFSGAMGGLNAIVGAGDMTMQNLADALSTGLLAPMKTYGLTLNDVGGALATFGDNNIRGQDAATKLISAVRIMAAPSKAAAKELKGVGLSTLSLANDMRKGGLVLALQDLKTHLNDAGLTASQQGLVIARAFGGRQSTGVQVLLSQLDRLQAKTTEVGAGAKGFGASWAATQQTAAFKTQAALATMKADLTQFGNDVLPTLLKIGGTVVKDVDKVAHAFASLPKGAQDAIITGGLVLAGIGPALKIVGATASLIGRADALAKGAARLLGGGSLAGSLAKGGVKGLTTVGTMEVATLIAKTMVGGGASIPGGAGGLSQAEREAITVAEGTGGGVGAIALMRAAVSYGVERAVPIGAAVVVGVAIGKGLKSQFPHGFFPPTAPTPGDVAAYGMGFPVGSTASLQRVLSGGGAPGVPTSAQPATIAGGQGPLPASVHKALSQYALDAQHAQGAVDTFGAHAARVLKNLGEFARLSGDQPWHFADMLASGLLRGQTVSSRGIRNIITEVNRLPPAARDAADRAMVNLVVQLETKGAVAVGTTYRFTTAITAQFARMAVSVRGQIAAMVQAVDSAMGSLNFSKPGLGLPGVSGLSQTAPPGLTPSPSAPKAAHKQPSAATLAALGLGPNPTAATIPVPKIPAVHIPTPPAPTLIPSQLVGAQIKMAELANQLTIAQNSGNLVAQTKALNAELKLEHNWLKADSNRLTEVNHALHNTNLSSAKHKQLLADKLALLQEINGVLGQIGSAQSTLDSQAPSKIPKVYYRDNPRGGLRQTVGGAGNPAAAGAAGKLGRGLTINGGLHVHGSHLAPHQVTNDLYLRIRPYLTAPAG